MLCKDLIFITNFARDKRHGGFSGCRAMCRRSVERGEQTCCFSYINVIFNNLCILSY